MAEKQQNEQTDVDLDPEAKRLKLGQIKAEARKAIIEANTAAAKALLPAIPGDLGDTVTEGEGASALASIVAVEALKEAALQIAKSVTDKTQAGDQVLIVEKRFFAEADVLLAQVRAQLTRHVGHLREATDTLLDEAKQAAAGKSKPVRYMLDPVTAAAGASALLGFGASLISAMRSQYSTSGQTVEIDDTVLIDEVAHELVEFGRAPIVAGFAAAEAAKVIQDFSAAQDAALQLRKAIDERRRGAAGIHERAVAGQRARIKSAESQYDTLRKEGDPKAKNVADLLVELHAELDRLESDDAASRLLGQLQHAESVLSDFETWSTAVVATPESGTSPLVTAAVRELTVGDVGSGARRYLLHLSVVAAAGQTVSQSGAAFTDARTIFMGGIGVSHLLADGAGKVLSAGTSTHYSGNLYEYGRDQFRKLRLDDA